MGQLQWFYRSEEQWNAIAERLKQTPCPRCNADGTLIRHGFLYGFDETNPQGTKILRARRIFCSNRNARPGCGHTFSVWLADKIRRLSITTHALWRFLRHAVAGSIAAAMHATNCQRSERTWRRIWKRFNLRQCNIRTALSERCQPPNLPADPAKRPPAQVLAHLQAAFPNDDCPIATFQHLTHTFFL